MFYIIEEAEKNNIQNYKEFIKIGLTDFSYLDNPEKLITETLKQDKLLTMINFPDSIISLIIKTVLEDENIDILKDRLTDIKLPLYSIIISLVSSYKEKYKKILEFQNASYILMVANSNNLDKIIDLAIKLDKKVIIDGKNIPFVKYKDVLSKYDLNALTKIEINYQEHNNIVTLKEVYLASLLVGTIINNIQKYNLSTLEKIIYVYDVVKSEQVSSVMKQDTKNNSSFKDSNSIFYSNLFNAILVSLGINAVPFINEENNYQRSLVYLKDKKYNIDGVYVFDPCSDRKMGEKYIDNYKYFAITPGKSQKEIKTTNITNTNISFDEILMLYHGENKNLVNVIDTLNEIELLFNLIGEDSYSEFDEIVGMYQFTTKEEKVKAINMYKNFISKYNPKEIQPVILVEALFNTRIIEYYNGVIDSFTMRDIKEAVKIRNMFQKFNYEEAYSNLNVIELIKHSKLLDNELNESISEKEEELTRKDLNIRLLKVLKMNKNK